MSLNLLFSLKINIARLFVPSDRLFVSSHVFLCLYIEFFYSLRRLVETQTKLSQKEIDLKRFLICLQLLKYIYCYLV